MRRTRTLKNDRRTPRLAMRRLPVRKVPRPRRLLNWEVEDNSEETLRELTERITRGEIIHGHLL